MDNNNVKTLTTPFRLILGIAVLAFLLVLGFILFHDLLKLKKQVPTNLSQPIPKITISYPTATNTATKSSIVHKPAQLPKTIMPGSGSAYGPGLVPKDIPKP